ncbi:peptidase S9 [Mesorhizobium sp. SARCC-RB16n]|uniref:prolyl oligopeptidase family serine peptidase n=1 Tax=Mesorhizobium sp. SARCC-RB16n TaxID=2116687 RepID=UPI00122F6580|nr:prolyl oligopeptidase family serine peptidase [Mesorhizobium sp. SARCC-RB16n]KAA3447932.1 peptidase S9 [Mesorhizobium sp. SARCC-RB16n]
MTVDDPLQPPLPRTEPRIRVLHDEVTIDRYGWLRDQEDPDVRAYLEAENSYADQATAHLKELKAQLIAEIEGRMSCNGDSPGFQVGPYEYFQRWQHGQTHPIWWRRPVTGGADELVVDPNAIHGSQVFYRLGVLEPSDDGRYVAFSFDLVGDESYALIVRDMESGREIWRDKRRVVHVVWATDGHTLFFERERTGPRRCNQIVRLDVEAADSKVVFEEVNEQLALRVRRSDSGAWLFLDVFRTCDNSAGPQKTAVEVWSLPADRPLSSWRRIVKRDLGVEVFAEHWQNSFLFRVDDVGPNFRLVRAPMDDPSLSCWEEVIPSQFGVTLEQIHLLEGHLIILEREGLRPRLVSLDRNGRITTTIVPDEPSCTLGIGVSAGGHYSVPRHAFRGSKLVYSISSFVTPHTIVKHDLDRHQSTILHRTLIPGYDGCRYEASVAMAQAEDGTNIPISLVARRDRPTPGPILLYVYGCYGTSIWPSFNAARLSLLDRGVAFGIAHVRGGGELGRPWREAAMGGKKRMTYTDLIDAVGALVELGYACPDRVVIQGQSGGGGTVLATATLRPELFRAVVAEVPVADILDTQLDFSLPYALLETAEYGNPQRAGDYRYLRTYDPYYNLSHSVRLPPTYVDTSLNDGQVLCYQPARYVAQRRSISADRDPQLILRTQFVGGHGGASHGAEVAEEPAFRIAWMLDHLTCLCRES